MNTNRPFFSGFLSAFRARSSFQTATTSPTGAVSGASLTKAQKAAAMSKSANALPSSSPSPSTKTSNPASHSASTQGAIPPSTSPLNVRPETTRKTNPHALPISYSRHHHHPQHHHHHHHAPSSASPGTSPGRTRGFLGSGSSAGSSSMSPSSATNSTGQRRRGSDSSSEGFREILGADKWLIGGRTAAGEDKFYRLGMVRKPPSIDRLSADRLSL